MDTHADAPRFTVCILVRTQYSECNNDGIVYGISVSSD